MDSPIDPVRYSNLKVIARLKQGEKLRTRGHRFKIDEYDPKTWPVQSMTRWTQGENRYESVSSITSLIESCITQKGMTPESQAGLARQFEAVLRGVLNLAVTYKDDTTICAYLELVIEMLEGYIAKHGVVVETHEDESLSE